jgi:hypothetical protein
MKVAVVVDDDALGKEAVASRRSEDGEIHRQTVLVPPSLLGSSCFLLLVFRERRGCVHPLDKKRTTNMKKNNKRSRGGCGQLGST